MSAISPPSRGNTWVFQVTALCVVLGMLMALALKTQRRSVEEGIPNRLPALKAEFRATKDENENLKQELAGYKVRCDELERREAAGLKGAQSIQDSLQQARLLAGTAPAHGPGVVVALNDSPKLNPEETNEDIINDYLVHDYDIRQIVNELFSSGAEAVSVNGQRMIATSSVRCVGSAVLVNSVQVAPPIMIKAIGDTDVLEKSLELQGGAAENLFLLDMIEIIQQQDIVVPAYQGAIRFEAARPVEEDKENKEEH